MYTPYPHQDEARDAVFQYYAKGGTGNPVVAMPGGTGKSLVIAEFCKFVMQRWPRQRIMMLTHVKELIQQNAEKIRSQWPQVPLGVFSAGLGERDTHFPIIYGGVGSVVNCIEAFGWRDLLIVDEAHLIAPKENSDYQKIIAGLKLINPRLKVIGFTATPWRMGQGMITDGGMFTDICYDLCSIENFNKLLDDGFLSPLIPKHTKEFLDTSKVKITAGEFNKHDLQEAVDKEDITYKACFEACEEGYDRLCWLVFASGITHAEHVAKILQSMGIDAAAVHSKMPTKQADDLILKYRTGQLRCLVNYGKLTTGFDHPPIDLIVHLRPTMSTALWVQMLSRGTRPSSATRKENCLVLDFARNTIRLGPINDPVIPRKRVKGSIPGVAPVRICPACGVYNHARATICCACGVTFPKNEKLVAYAGTEELIRRETPVIKEFEVKNVVYNRHVKPGSPPMIRAQYFCGLQRFSEVICFEHGGYVARKARQWWQQVTGLFVSPPTTDEALKYIAQLKKPKTIRVQTNRKYPEIISHEY